jgi:hypothetical protein
MSNRRPPRLRCALVSAVAITAVVAPAAPARVAPEAVSSDRNPPPVMVTDARDECPGAVAVRGARRNHR